jgi:hypothetical protein
MNEWDSGFVTKKESSWSLRFFAGSQGIPTEESYARADRRFMNWRRMIMSRLCIQIYIKCYTMLTCMGVHQFLASLDNNPFAKHPKRWRVPLGDPVTCTLSHAPWRHHKCTAAVFLKKCITLYWNALTMRSLTLLLACLFCFVEHSLCFSPSTRNSCDRRLHDNRNSCCRHDKFVHPLNAAVVSTSDKDDAGIVDFPPPLTSMQRTKRAIEFYKRVLPVLAAYKHTKPKSWSLS